MLACDAAVDEIGADSCLVVLEEKSNAAKSIG